MTMSLLTFYRINAKGRGYEYHWPDVSSQTRTVERAVDTFLAGSHKANAQVVVQRLPGSVWLLFNRMSLEGVDDEYGRDRVSAVFGCVIESSPQLDARSVVAATTKCLALPNILSRERQQLANWAQSPSTVEEIRQTLFERIDREANTAVNRALVFLEEMSRVRPIGTEDLEAKEAQSPSASGEQALLRIANAVESLAARIDDRPSESWTATARWLALAFAVLAFAVGACMAILLMRVM